MIAFDNRIVTDPGELASIVAHARSAGAPQTPCFQWAAKGSLKVTCLRKSKSVLPHHVGSGRMPELVIIGDDPPTGYGSSVGPAGWQAAGSLRVFRPAAALIHATSGDARDYSSVAFAAMSSGRFLVIECASYQAGAWFEMIHHWCPTTVFWPSDGTHPVQEKLH